RSATPGRAAGASEVACCCLVPREAAGLVIGPGGSGLRQIYRETSAHVTVSGEGDTPAALTDRVVTISGGADQKAAACREIVRIVHRSQDVPEGAEGVFVALVPAPSAGFVVGPQGATVSALVETSGAEVSVSRVAIAGTELLPVSITGGLEQTAAAAAGLTSLLQDLADRGRLHGEPWLQARPRPVRSRASSASAASADRGAGEGRGGGGVGACDGLVRAAPGGAGRGSAGGIVLGGSKMGPRSPAPRPGARAAGALAGAALLAPGAEGRGAAAAPGALARGAGRRHEERHERSALCEEVTTGMFSQREEVWVVSRRTRAGSSRLGGLRAEAQAGPLLASPEAPRQEEAACCFLVDVPVAAWIVGRGGRGVEALRAASGAAVEVERSGGRLRSVTLRGPAGARERAAALLLEAAAKLPAGAPDVTRVLVPAAVAGCSAGLAAVRDLVLEVGQAPGLGVELTDPGPEGERLVCLSGGSLAATSRAAQLLAARLPEAPARPPGGAAPAEAQRPGYRRVPRSCCRDLVPPETWDLYNKVYPEMSRAPSRVVYQISAGMASCSTKGVDDPKVCKVEMGTGMQERNRIWVSYTKPSDDMENLDMDEAVTKVTEMSRDQQGPASIYVDMRAYAAQFIEVANQFAQDMGRKAAQRQGGRKLERRQAAAGRWKHTVESGILNQHRAPRSVDADQS
ncbi:unnamed protein product, partial [Prorocentrum cordatum]